MLTKKELKTRIYEAFNEQLSAEGFKFRKRDETFLRKEDDDTCFLITLYFYGFNSQNNYGLDIICGIKFERLLALEKELCGNSKIKRLVTGKSLKMIVPNQLQEMGRNEFYTHDSEKELLRKVNLIIKGIKNYGLPYLSMMSEKECTLRQMEMEGITSYPTFLPLSFLLWYDDRVKCMELAKSALYYYAQWRTDKNEQYNDYLFFYERLKQYVGEDKE